MLKVQGFVEPQFLAVKKAFENNFVQYGEFGAAVAIMLDGKEICHLWAGTKDRHGETVWREDTLVNVFSVTKGIVSCCALQLVADGRLSLDKPVAFYWPEFAAHAKDTILIRHVLHHISGLTAFHEEIPPEDLYDFARMAEHCANELLWAPPGSQQAYTPFTFGWIVGELIKRVTGLTVGEYFRRHVATQHEELDIYIGVPTTELERVADVLPLQHEALMADQTKPRFNDMAIKAFSNPASMMYGTNSHRWRQSEIPAANGHATALALAKFYDLLLSGSLLPREMIARCSEVQVEGIDAVTNQKLQFSHGFMLLSHSLARSSANGEISVMPPSSFGHPGAGGSLAFVDPENKISFAYVTRGLADSTLLVDLRARQLILALYSMLKPNL